MIQPFAGGHAGGQTLDAHPIWSPVAAPGPRTARRLCETAAFAAAAAFAVPVGEIHAMSRRSSYVALARQAAMYVAHVSFGISFSDIGRAFGRDRTTAAHACRLIEDRRDDPTVDVLLASLENACRSLRRRLSGGAQP